MERNGTLGKVLNNDAGQAFLSRYSKEAQLVFKVAAQVDGTDGLANGVNQLLLSFLGEDPTRKSLTLPIYDDDYDDDDDDY